MATTAGGLPYVEPSDLVSGWPAVSQDLAEELDSQLAAKAPLVEPSITSGINITSATSAGYLDFRTSAGEDFDCRIEQNNNGLVLLTGGEGSAAARMTIDSAGNVGIGATAPTDQRFHIRGKDTTTSNYALVVSNSAATTLAYVRNDGVIAAPPTYANPVGATNRDLYIDANGMIGYVSSIRASKTEIIPQAAPSWLLDLTPVTFRYRAKNEDGAYTDIPDGPVQYGLIAEDVEAVNPDLVFYDDTETGPELRGVSYSKIVTPLLALVQAQQAQIDALTARVSALESA